MYYVGWSGRHNIFACEVLMDDDDNNEDDDMANYRNGRWNYGENS